MRRITAIVCGVLFIVFFGFAFGGSSAGHRVRIVVRHAPNQNDASTGISGQTELDLLNDPHRMDTERYTASLGVEGISYHLRWVQNKAVSGRYCVTMNHLNEIEDALPILLGNTDRSEIRQFTHSNSNAEKMPLIYCTVTDNL